MGIQDLCNEVYLITNRPDLVNETALSVRSATLKAHQSDYFPKDMRETEVIFLTSDCVQALDYSKIDPKWRSLNYARILQTSASGSCTPGAFFELIDPVVALGMYGETRTNVAYQAGTVYQLKSACPFSRALLGYYVHPTIAPDADYASWIADEFPYVIIFDAAARIFKMVGFDEQANYWQQEVAQQYQNLKSQVIGNGY